jgi:putative Holliday junction resolvase
VTAQGEEVILGLDVGEARIGLAVWDASRGARDVGVIRRVSQAEDVRRIVGIAAERGATRIVVGLPRNADGSEGPQAKASRRFAAALGRAAPIPVELLDEYETTREATAELGLGGQPLDARDRGRVDARSATILLRRYVGLRDRAG